MKNLKTYLLVFILPAVFFMSCGEGDSDPVSIEGSWLLQNQQLSILVNGIPFSADLLAQFGVDASDLEIPEGTILEIASGGQLTVNSPGEPSVSGTWSLSTDGNVLTLVQSGESLEFEVVELTANNLNLKISESEQVEQNGIPVNVEVELKLVGTRQ